MPDRPRQADFDSVKACSKGELVLVGGSIFAFVNPVVRGRSLICGLSLALSCFGFVFGATEVFADVRPQSLPVKRSSEACKGRIGELPSLRLVPNANPILRPTIIRKYAKAVSIFSPEEIAAGAFSVALHDGLLAKDGVYNYLISADGRLLISPHYVAISKYRIYLSDHASLSLQYGMQSEDLFPIGGQIQIFHGRVVQINQKSTFSLGKREHLAEAVEKFKLWGLEFSDLAPRYIESTSPSATNSSFRGNEDEVLILHSIHQDPELLEIYSEVKALHAELVIRMPSLLILGKVATENLTEIQSDKPGLGEKWMYFVHSLQDRGLHNYVWEMRENLNQIREELQALRAFVGIH